MSKYNHIKSLSFLSQKEAIAAALALNLGPLKEEKIGVLIYQLNDNGELIRDYSDDIYFSSKTEDAFYDYTIEKHEIYYVLKVYKTNKHGMISAAIDGDLESFKVNFDNRDKMIQFSLSTAIENNNWNIVEYLIENYDFKEKPLWHAIRYNKVDIIKKLLSKGRILPFDWLAYCMYSNSFDVMKELLEIQRAHLEYHIDEIKTKWYSREIRKNTDIAKYVKNILGEDR
jgi:hypothetical protein